MHNLEDYLATIQQCNHCGICKWVLAPKARNSAHTESCPIHARYHYDAYSAQGLLYIAQELLKQKLEYEPGLIDLIFQCTTCGACDINCKTGRDMEVLDTILALKAKCVEDGQGPKAQHKAFARCVEKFHNPYGHPHENRFEWLSEDVRLSKGSDVVYFAGCTSAYMQPEIARATVSILNSGGVEFDVLNQDEHCCGAQLWRTGQKDSAERVIRQNIETFAKRGIKTVITSCAECYGTFRGVYPRVMDPNLKILHITEVIEELLQEGKLTLTKTVNMKVTYHDPCLLGRLSERYVPWTGEIKRFGLHVPPKVWRRGRDGVYGPPRRILNAIPGIEFVEMDRNEENSFCCGGGGGVSAAFPDFALWTASKRIEEAKATGADAIVSCCPICASSFKNATSSGGEKIRCYDLTEVLANAL